MDKDWPGSIHDLSLSCRVSLTRSVGQSEEKSDEDEEGASFDYGGLGEVSSSSYLCFDSSRSRFRLTYPMQTARLAGPLSNSDKPSGRCIINSTNSEESWRWGEAIEDTCLVRVASS